MELSERDIPIGRDLGRFGWKHGKADGEGECQISCIAVGRIGAAIRQLKDAYGTHAADKIRAHDRVVIIAYRVLDTRAVWQQSARQQHERKCNPDYPNGPSLRYVG